MDIWLVMGIVGKFFVVLIGDIVVCEVVVEVGFVVVKEEVFLINKVVILRFCKEVFESLIY